MIRLTRHNLSESEAVVRVEGHLTAETIDEVRRLLGQPAPPGGVTIDLSGLLSADAAAREHLRGLKRSGHRLIGASLYIQAVIEEAAT